MPKGTSYENKKYWYMLLLSVVFATAYVILSLYIPKLIGLGTDRIIGQEKLIL